MDGRSGIAAIVAADTFPALSDALAKAPVDIVLIDVTQGVDPRNLGGLLAQHPGLPWLALGLDGQRHEPASPGCASPAAYVPRSASIEALCQALAQAAARPRPTPSEAPRGGGGLLTPLGRWFANPFRAGAPSSAGGKRAG